MLVLSGEFSLQLLMRPLPQMESAGIGGCSAREPLCVFRTKLMSAHCSYCKASPCLTMAAAAGCPTSMLPIRRPCRGASRLGSRGSDQQGLLGVQAVLQAATYEEGPRRVSCA